MACAVQLRSRAHLRAPFNSCLGFKGLDRGSTNAVFDDHQTIIPRPGVCKRGGERGSRVVQPLCSAMSVVCPLRGHLCPPGLRRWAGAGAYGVARPGRSRILPSFGCAAGSYSVPGAAAAGTTERHVVRGGFPARPSPPVGHRGRVCSGAGDLPRFRMGVVVLR